MVGAFLMGCTTLFATIRSEWFDRPPKPIGDGMCYESIAFSLYNGHGFREDYVDQGWQELYASDSKYSAFLERVQDRNLPSTGRPPLMPLVIATVYAFVGRGALAFQIVRVFSALCVAAAVGLAVGLTAKILGSFGASRSPASLGAAIALGSALAQNTIRDYCTDFLTEPMALLLFQVLITIVLTTLLRLREAECRPNDSCFWAMATAGLIFGLLILTRSIFVLWLPGIVALLFFALPNTTKRVRAIIVFALAALTVCLPWWVRNCIVLERAMPLGTQGPIALVGGYCDQAYDDGGNWNHQPELLVRRRVDAQGSRNNPIAQELAVVAESRLTVRHWLSQNWDRVPSLAIKRAITHWNPYSGKALVWKFAIALGLFWCLQRTGRLNWWLVGPTILSTAVTMCLYETGGRFLVPLYGLLFTLGGLGVVGWLSPKPLSPNSRS